MTYNMKRDLQFDVGVWVSVGITGRQLHTAHHTDHQGVSDRGVLQSQEDLPPVMWQQVIILVCLHSEQAGNHVIDSYKQWLGFITCNKKPSLFPK